MRRLRQLAVRVGVAVGIIGGVVVVPLNAQGGPPPGWTWTAAAAARGPLRVLIIYDMEGLSGVDRHEMTTCAYPAQYAIGQARLVADVNAVIEGVSQAGVTAIDVIDRHGSGCDSLPDLPARQLDPRARYVDESAASLRERGMRSEWNAVLLVGGHASPGRGGFLEHTGSFGFERIINGVSISESEQIAQLFGGDGRNVPVIFASGDDRYRAQLRERMPWVTFAEVKRATSRMTAELRPPDVVRAELIAQAGSAVARRDSALALSAVAPFSGAYRPVWPHSLAPLAAIPGLDISSGEIRVTGASLAEVNGAISRIAGVVSSFTVSESMWQAIARDRKLDDFRDSLFMARWKAGPPPR